MLLANSSGMYRNFLLKEQASLAASCVAKVVCFATDMLSVELFTHILIHILFYSQWLQELLLNRKVKYTLSGIWLRKWNVNSQGTILNLNNVEL